MKHRAILLEPGLIDVNIVVILQNIKVNLRTDWTVSSINTGPLSE
jgi:hypothetical protein